MSSEAGYRRRARAPARYALSLALAIASQAPAGAQTTPDAEPLVNPAAPPAESLAPASSEGLTLAELEALALANSPSIARAAALVGAARGACLQAGLGPNPTVGYEGQQLGSGGRAEQHGVTFGQEFVTGGKLGLRRAAAAQEVAVAEQQLAAVRLRVLTDVRVAYYGVLVAQRKVQLAEDLVRLGDELTEAADALLRAKEVGRVDAIQADLERQQAAVALEGAQQRRDAAWRELAAVTGDAALAPQPLAGDPLAAGAALNFDDALVRLQGESPEVAAAAAELRRARLALARERREPLPNVTFQGLVNWRDNGISGDPDGGVAVSVPVPLVNRNQGAICQAERELAAANHALLQLELSLRQRLAPVYERYALATQQTTRYREAMLPQAVESLRLTRAMYQAGEVNYTALLVAQRTFAVINQDYLDAVLQLRTAEAQIEGLLLSGSLEWRR